MKEIYPWYLRAWVGPVALVAFIGFVMVMIVAFGSMEAARGRAYEAVLESRASVHGCQDMTSIFKKTQSILDVLHKIDKLFDARITRLEEK